MTSARSEDGVRMAKVAQLKKSGLYFYVVNVNPNVATWAKAYGNVEVEEHMIDVNRKWYKNLTTRAEKKYIRYQNRLLGKLVAQRKRAAQKPHDPSDKMILGEVRHVQGRHGIQTVILSDEGLPPELYKTKYVEIRLKPC